MKNQEEFKKYIDSVLVLSYLEIDISYCDHRSSPKCYVCVNVPPILKYVEDTIGIDKAKEYLEKY